MPPFLMISTAAPGGPWRPMMAVSGGPWPLTMAWRLISQTLVPQAFRRAVTKGEPALEAACRRPKGAAAPRLGSVNGRNKIFFLVSYRPLARILPSVRAIRGYKVQNGGADGWPQH